MISDVRTHRDTIVAITTVRLVVTAGLTAMLPSVWTTGMSAEFGTQKKHIKYESI